MFGYNTKPLQKVLGLIRCPHDFQTNRITGGQFLGDPDGVERHGGINAFPCSPY